MAEAAGGRVGWDIGFFFNRTSSQKKFPACEAGKEIPKLCQSAFCPDLMPRRRRRGEKIHNLFVFRLFYLLERSHF